ncbi:MAG: thioesterase family protein [Trueperaceae bacterium]|nr:thioesterase family protein [Trueperaceae bacterium]
MTARDDPGGADGRGPTGRTHRTPIQLRFRDTDMFGHVNNAVYATWAEIARISFLRNLDPPSGDLILARIELDFLAQISFGQQIEVHSKVVRVGRTSVTLDQTVLADEAEAARIGSVVVLYDYAHMRARPVTDAYRAALRPYLIDPTGG